MVQSGVVLGSDGFGYAQGPDGRSVLFPQIGTLRIEDDVEIGANTTIDRGALGETVIGRGTKIDNLVHIAHNCRIGEDVLIAAQVGMAGSCVIEDGVMLGGQVGLGERVTIGRGVILGGQGGVLPGKRLDGAGEVFCGDSGAACAGVPAEPGADEAGLAMAVVVVGGQHAQYREDERGRGHDRGHAGEALDGIQDYAVWAWGCARPMASRVIVRRPTTRSR